MSGRGRGGKRLVTIIGLGTLAVVLALALLVGFALTLPGAALAAGATFQVTCADGQSGPNGMQAALSSAVAGTPLTITIDTPDCLVSLSSSLTIGAGVDVTIDGNGLVLDDGQYRFPVITINDSSANPSTLSLDQVTVENGTVGISDQSSAATVNLTGSTVRGNSSDGIHTPGTTVLTGSTVYNNRANGIYAVGDTVNLTNSSVDSNSANGIWATTATVTGSTINANGVDGIYGTNVTVTGSTVSGNASGIDGATAVVSGSTVSGNTSNGGIFATTVTVTGSMVSGNHIFGVDGTTVTVTSSTVSGNSGFGVGGNTVKLTNGTVSGNTDYGISALTATVTNSTVSDDSGGVDASNATVVASILAGNTTNCAITTLTDGGYNLSTDGSCGFSATGSQNNASSASLNLSPLAQNGGPTATIALGPASIAINAIPVNGQNQCLNAAGTAIIDPSTGQPITTDQRGVIRPQGTGCDIGAYELIQSSYTQTESSCPTQAQLQDDFDLAGTTNGQLLTIDLPANCTIDLTSSLTIASGTDITLNGNGLTLSGGTAQAPGAFDIIDAGTGSVTLDATTLEYGQFGFLSSSFSDSSTDLTLVDSTVTGNSQQGVVVANSGSGTVTLVGSTISGNQGNGVEVYSGYDAASLTMVNSTISGNGGFGAYDDAYTTTATILDSTISHNASEGLDLSSQRSALQATITSTILADNGLADASANCDTGGASITDGGYNRSTDTTCGFTSSTSLPNGTVTTPPTDQQLNLLPLGNYGGPTQTIALGPGSDAIDAIPTAACSSIIDPMTNQPITTDQRGIARPQGTGCDIGAYEAPALSLAVSPAAPNGSNGWDTTDPTVTLGYSGLAVGQDASGATQAQVAACTGLSGLSHTATTLNDDGTVQSAVSSDGAYAIGCGITQGTTALGVSYSGPSLPLDLKVDTIPPAITITTPRVTSYTLHETVDADYGCSDATSGITSANCVGPVADGSPIDTGTLGSHTFTVNAKDNAGNTATKTVTYTVGYAMTSLPGSTTTVNPGYYALIRFAPEDAQGHDYASRTLTVTSVELEGPNGQTIPFAYPFQYGTFSGKPGYQLSINTRNLSPGSWTLEIRIGSGKSATTTSIDFRVE